MYTSGGLSEVDLQGSTMMQRMCKYVYGSGMNEIIGRLTP